MAVEIALLAVSVVTLGAAIAALVSTIRTLRRIEALFPSSTIEALDYDPRTRIATIADWPMGVDVWVPWIPEGE